MSSGQIALLISFGSLLVAAISLGWNVYRDVIRKPKLVIKLMVGAIIFSKDKHADRVVVTITNSDRANLSRRCFSFGRHPGGVGYSVSSDLPHSFMTMSTV